MPSKITKQKRIMTKFKLTEISAVDKPAQSPAVAVIMKRTDELIEKRYLLSSNAEGHSHLLYMDKWEEVNKGGETSWTESHYHPFVINDDGSITIGMAEGHTHSTITNVADIFKSGLNQESIAAILAVTKSSFDKPTANPGGDNPEHIEETSMPDIKKAVHDTALEQIKTLEKSLSTAVSIGSLSNTQRTFFDAQDNTGKDIFLAKSVEDRENVVKAASDANAVIYTSSKGVDFRKSDDPRLVEMAKDGDIMAAQIAKATQVTADNAIQTRAVELFKNLTGDVTTHTALLKAVDGIADVEVRKAVMLTLEKQDAGIATLLQTHGTTTVNKHAGDAEKQLESLAKAEVTKDPTLNYFDAYSKVVDANPELYQKAVG